MEISDPVTAITDLKGYEGETVTFAMEGADLESGQCPTLDITAADIEITTSIFQDIVSVNISDVSLETASEVGQKLCANIDNDVVQEAAAPYMPYALK